jgi:hypothetical protein
MPEGKTISSTKNLKVLRELVMAGADGLSASHAAILSGLSLPSVFRALDELRESGIVENVGSIWRVVAGSLYAEQAVGLLDAERYMMLEGLVQQEISGVDRKATSFFGPDGFALVAFGSSIGEGPLNANDVDILLVADNPSGFHVDTARMKASISFYAYNEIEDMWREGDQFVQNTVARGIIVRDPFDRLARLRIAAHRRVDTEQTLDAYIKSYKKELELYSRAYKSENWEEAARHRAKLADNLTRQWLMRLRVQPKSRTELAGQLRILSASLFNAFNNLTKEIPSNRRQSERADKELWRYRSLTSQLSDETPEFLDLLDMLYGNRQEAENGVFTFLLSRGFEVTDSLEAKTDMLVKDPGSGKSLTLEVKSLKPGLDKKNVGIYVLNRAGTVENLCLVYNPYKDIPADERVFAVNPEVARMAEEKGIRLIPSNVFFSEACDLLINEISKSEWLESLLGITPEVTGNRVYSNSR